MKKILFKAKKIDDQEWIKGDLITTVFLRREEGREDEPIPYILDVTKADYDCFDDLAEDNGIIEVEPETLCQYTGLIDNNGRKIWEHDIVRAWSEGSCAVGEVRQRIDGLWIIYPAWEGREFWGLCPNKKGETTVEVLGNIFEDPDLLNPQN